VGVDTKPPEHERKVRRIYEIYNTALYDTSRGRYLEIIF
jgi:hypothetical protein